MTMTEHADTPKPFGPVVVLLFCLWLFATPVLLWNALWNSVAFFGETPPSAQLEMARWQALGALTTGLGAPAVGLWLSLRGGDTAQRRLFGVALGLSLVAAVGGVWFLSAN
jgi:hypothetical protein